MCCLNLLVSKIGDANNYKASDGNNGTNDGNYCQGLLQLWRTGVTWDPFREYILIIILEREK